MRPFSRDAHAPLLRAIRSIVAAVCPLERFPAQSDRISPASAGIPLLVVESLGHEPWASATFIGQTHWLEVRLEGQAELLASVCARLQAALPDAEIPVPGSIVADIAVEVSPIVSQGEQAAICSLRLEVLTIDD